MPTPLEGFACPCCGLYRVSNRLITLDELLHIAFGDRLRRSSGTRCRAYNTSEEIKGSRTSGHLPIWGPENNESVAGDYELIDATETDLRRLMWTAIQEGALGVGYMPDDNALHVDLKPRGYGVALWIVRDGKITYFFNI